MEQVTRLFNTNMEVAKLAWSASLNLASLPKGSV